MSACVLIELRYWDMLLCCCRVGAPLGQSVLVCCFPAVQHFAGPQGDSEGTYDWAMQSCASLSYRSEAAYPFGIRLSFCLQPPAQHSSRHSNKHACSSLRQLVRFRAQTTQSWYLQVSGCACCCHKDKMDISALLSQHGSVLT